MCTVSAKKWLISCLTARKCKLNALTGNLYSSKDRLDTRVLLSVLWPLIAARPLVHSVTGLVVPTRFTERASEDRYILAQFDKS